MACELLFANHCSRVRESKSNRGGGGGDGGGGRLVKGLSKRCKFTFYSVCRLFKACHLCFSFEFVSSLEFGVSYLLLITHKKFHQLKEIFEI